MAMIQKKISCLSFHRIGREYIFIVFSFRNEVPPVKAATQVYTDVAKILTERKFKIVHERIFGSLDVQKEFVEARARLLQTHNIASDNRITYIQ
jgi:virulence-associated protein VapD